jgi:hypothetical protein
MELVLPHNKALDSPAGNEEAALHSLHHADGDAPSEAVRQNKVPTSSNKISSLEINIASADQRRAEWGCFEFHASFYDLSHRGCVRLGARALKSIYEQLIERGVLEAKKEHLG